MSLFSKQNKRKDYTLVATQISPRECSYMTLFCLAKGVSKATLIRGLIEKWSNENRLLYSETNLVKDIIIHLNMRWKIDKSQGLLSFADYKEIVKDELTEKNIKETHIIVILSELKQ